MTTMIAIHGMGARSDLRSQSILTDWCLALRLDKSVTKCRSLQYSDWSWLPGEDLQGLLWDESRFAEDLSGVLLRSAANAPDAELRQWALEATGQLGAQLEAEQGPMGVTRNALALLSKVPIFAENGFAGLSRVQRWNLWQVDAYVNDIADTKSIVLDRARTLFETADPPFVVLAHSLGSLIAYEAIHMFSPDTTLLVTFGSPLGIPRIIRPKLVPEGVYPDSVRQWMNVYDLDDPVAAVANLAPHYPSRDGRAVAPYQVKNVGRWAWHKATAYLQQDIVRSSTAEALRA